MRREKLAVRPGRRCAWALTIAAYHEPTGL